MDKQTIINKLKKIKALSEKGVNGEMDSANSMLEELMKKYGITEEDLGIEEEPKTRFFNAKENLPLFVQIALKVFGKKTRGYKNKIKQEYRMYYTDNGELGDIDFNVSVDCTKAEFLEIKFYYETYLADYKKQLEVFYYAYLDKNNLLMPCDEDKQPTAEENKIAINALMMQQGIEKKVVNKAIENM